MTVATAKTPTYATVPRLFDGGTIACLATGPSLTQADVDFVRGKVDGVVAVNNAYTVAPWADVLYACDAKFWKWHHGVEHFAGVKYTLAREATRWPGVQLLRNAGDDGLTRNPSALRTGKSSGYQAINLAVHLGAARVILLGYDMHGGHFFGNHPDNSKPPFGLCIRKFASIVEPLRKAGVVVVNCTRKTALTCFPRMALTEALCGR